MKTLICILFALAGFASQAQIKEIKIDSNYVVMTDTVSTRVDWVYPRKDVRYEVTGSKYVIFYGRNDNRISKGQSSYHVDSLVDDTAAKFANIAAFETWLRENTGN